MSKKKKFGVSNALSRGISDTINIVEHNEGILRSVIIPLSRIQVDPNNPRKLAITEDDIRNGLKKDDPQFRQKELELNKLHEVAKTIKNSGILNPITVYKYGNDYRIVAGERRYLASLIVGLNEIDARVYNNPPKGFSLKLAQWVENTAREDLNLMEKLENIKDMANAYRQQNPSEQLNATWLHNVTGLSLAQTTYYMAVLNAPEDVKNAIKEGHINSLDKAYMITTIKQADLRKEAIQACINGSSLKELKQINKKIKNIHKKEKVVDLGRTKSCNVVKAIIEAVIKLPEHNELQYLFTAVKWNDFKETKKAFEKFISALEGKIQP